MSRLLTRGVIQQGALLKQFIGSIMMAPESSTTIGVVPVNRLSAFSIVGGSDALLFSINESSGILSFNEAKSYLVPTDANSDGFYNVRVKSGSREQDIVVAVYPDKKFRMNGFLNHADLTYNTSANWKSDLINVIGGGSINYRLHAVYTANIITFFDIEGGVISSIAGAMVDVSVAQIGVFNIPSTAKTALITTHNTYIADSSYSGDYTSAGLHLLLPSIRTITVDKNVTANPSLLIYNTIAGALAVSRWGDRVNISSGIFSEYGLNIPNGVYVKGIGDVVVNGSLAASATSAQVDAISTIDFHYTGKLENITVTGKNMRYPIHTDDTAMTGYRIQEFVNVKSYHLGNNEVWQYRTTNAIATPNSAAETFRACSALGGGTSNADMKYFYSCEFESPMRAFSMHNNTTFTSPSLVYVENCKMSSLGIDFDNTPINFNLPIFIQSLVSNTPDLIVLNNCTATGYLGFYNALTHRVLHNINNIKTIYNTGGAGKTMIDDIASVNPLKYGVDQKSENNYENLGGVTITRGNAVKKSGDGVEMMTSADAASLFYGVAMQEIAINEYGDIRTSGYLLRPYLNGLGAITVVDGDAISVTATGSFEKSTTKTVMISAENQNVKVK